MVRGLGAVSVMLRTAVQQNAAVQQISESFYIPKIEEALRILSLQTLLFIVHGEPQLTCAANIYKLSHRSRSESEIAAARTAESVCNQGTDVEKQLLE